MRLVVTDDVDFVFRSLLVGGLVNVAEGLDTLVAFVGKTEGNLNRGR